MIYRSEGGVPETALCCHVPVEDVAGQQRHHATDNIACLVYISHATPASTQHIQRCCVCMAAGAADEAVMITCAAGCTCSMQKQMRAGQDTI
jgi:hypothetical protein